MSDLLQQLDDARADLVDARAARRAILQGAQSYRRGSGGADVQVARADLTAINATISQLQKEIARLEQATGQSSAVIPVYGVIPPC